MTSLERFDPCRDAVIDPDMIFHKMPDLLETLVSVFSHKLFKAMLAFPDGNFDVN